MGKKFGYVSRGTVTLLDELLKFPDVKPVPMQGGGKDQPWLMPIYGASGEMELIDFLYTFVRLLKPELVVELGCHLGLSTYGLGRACQDNGKGRIVACDIEDSYVIASRARCEGLPVTIHWMNAGWLPETKDADFLFIDCDYDNRMGALATLKTGAVAVVHDTRQEPPLREAIEKQITERVHFDTWRGFSIIRKS